MKRVEQGLWSGWCLVVWAWLGVACHGAEQIRVEPWFDSNAVLLAPQQFQKPVRGGEVFLGGTLRGRINVEVGFRGVEQALEAEDNLQLDKPKDGWTPWGVRLAQASKKTWDRLRLPDGFDVLLRVEGAKAPELVLTNLVFGQVHAVHVDPKRDGHQLPVPGAEARNRVRVLFLPEGGAPGQAARWMTVGEAVDRNVPAFCGLPRALAEQLVRTDVRTIGLVVIPDAAAAPRGSRPLSIESPYWKAAQDPRFPDSGSRRKQRRDEEEEIESRRRKRDGEVFQHGPQPATWTRHVTTEESKLPFPVTAEVW